MKSTLPSIWSGRAELIIICLVCLLGCLTLVLTTDFVADAQVRNVLRAAFNLTSVALIAVTLLFGLVWVRSRVVKRSDLE